VFWHDTTVSAQECVRVRQIYSLQIMSILNPTIKVSFVANNRKKLYLNKYLNV